MVAAWRARVTGVKIDFDDRAAQIGQFGRGPGTPIGRPGGQHHAQAALAGVLARDRERDVGGAAEQQDRLRAAQSIHHLISSRRARSELKMPCGSTWRRTVRNSSSRGYICRKAAALSRESLAR